MYLSNLYIYWNIVYTESCMYKSVLRKNKQITKKAVFISICVVLCSYPKKFILSNGRNLVLTDNMIVRVIELTIGFHRNVCPSLVSLYYHKLSKSSYFPSKSSPTPHPDNDYVVSHFRLLSPLTSNLIWTQ